MILAPHGREGIVAAFGDPLPFVTQKPRWEADILQVFPLPFAIPYAYGPTTVSVIRAHRLVGASIVAGLRGARARGVPAERLVYGGCYCWRPKRGGTDLSVHTWGIAIDLDPGKNPQGKLWVDDGVMLDPRIVEVFRDLGYCWGNGFGTPDPQHLQFAFGY